MKMRTDNGTMPKCGPVALAAATDHTVTEAYAAFQDVRAERKGQNEPRRLRIAGVLPLEVAPAIKRLTGRVVRQEDGDLSLASAVATAAKRGGTWLLATRGHLFAVRDGCVLDNGAFFPCAPDGSNAEFIEYGHEAGLKRVRHMWLVVPPADKVHVPTDIPRRPAVVIRHFLTEHPALKNGEIAEMTRSLVPGAATTASSVAFYRSALRRGRMAA